MLIENPAIYFIIDMVAAGIGVFGSFTLLMRVVLTRLSTQLTSNEKRVDDLYKIRHTDVDSITAMLHDLNEDVRGVETHQSKIEAEMERAFKITDERMERMNRSIDTLSSMMNRHQSEAQAREEEYKALLENMSSTLSRLMENVVHRPHGKS